MDEDLLADMDNSGELKKFQPPNEIGEPILQQMLVRELGLNKRQLIRRKIPRFSPMDKIAEDNFVEKDEYQYTSCKLASQFQNEGPRNPADFIFPLSSSTKSTFLMVFSPDHELIASTHKDHKIYISKVKTGECIKVLNGHPRSPWCVAFHPTLKGVLASGCLAGHVRVWDLNGNSEEWIAEGGIASLTFHPTDKLLVIATSKYNQLHFWNWTKPNPFATIRTQYPEEIVKYVKFDSSGTQLITGIVNVDLEEMNSSVSSEEIHDYSYRSRRRPFGNSSYQDPTSRSSNSNNGLSFDEELQLRNIHGNYFIRGNDNRRHFNQLMDEYERIIYDYSNLAFEAMQLNYELPAATSSSTSQSSNLGNQNSPRNPLRIDQGVNATGNLYEDSMASNVQNSASQTLSDLAQAASNQLMAENRREEALARRDTSNVRATAASTSTSTRLFQDREASGNSNAQRNSNTFARRRHFPRFYEYDESQPWLNDRFPAYQPPMSLDHVQDIISRYDFIRRQAAFSRELSSFEPLDLRGPRREINPNSELLDAETLAQVRMDRLSFLREINSEDINRERAFREDYDSEETWTPLNLSSSSERTANSNSRETFQERYVAPRTYIPSPISRQPNRNSRGSETTSSNDRGSNTNIEGPELSQTQERSDTDRNPRFQPSQLSSSSSRRRPMLTIRRAPEEIFFSRRRSSSRRNATEVNHSIVHASDAEALTESIAQNINELNNLGRRNRNRPIDVDRLCEHIDHMHEIVTNNLASMNERSQRPEIIRLQSIRRMIVDLQVQTRCLRIYSRNRSSSRNRSHHQNLLGATQQSTSPSRNSRRNQTENQRETSELYRIAANRKSYLLSRRKHFTRSEANRSSRKSQGISRKFSGEGSSTLLQTRGNRKHQSSRVRNQIASQLRATFHALEMSPDLALQKNSRLSRCKAAASQNVMEKTEADQNKTNDQPSTSQAASETIQSQDGIGARNELRALSQRIERLLRERREARNRNFSENSFSSNPENSSSNYENEHNYASTSSFSQSLNHTDSSFSSSAFQPINSDSEGEDILTRNNAYSDLRSSNSAEQNRIFPLLWNRSQLPSNPNSITEWRSILRARADRRRRERRRIALAGLSDLSPDFDEFRSNVSESLPRLSELIWRRIHRRYQQSVLYAGRLSQLNESLNSDASTSTSTLNREDRGTTPAHNRPIPEILNLRHNFNFQRFTDRDYSVTATGYRGVLNHRIQVWDFSSGDIPDISDRESNVVVSKANIHNDASVDISLDGTLLVALIPSEVSMTTVVGVYCLSSVKRGFCYGTTNLQSSIVSVNFSPTSQYLLIGLTSRLTRFALVSDRNVMAQVYKVKISKEGEPGYIVHRKNLEHRESGHSSLNCIRWIPIAGHGIVYATSTGLLKIMR